MNRRKIIFVATREPSYSRVAITLEQLKSKFDVDTIVSRRSSYAMRMLSVIWQLLRAWISGKLRNSDAVFVGFLAQPILPIVRVLHRGVIVSDAYFSLYDAMVNDKEKVSAKSFTAKGCFWLDHFMLKHSTMCFTDTQQHVEFMRAFFNVPKADVRRLWISADSEPVKIHPHLNGPFEVFFWGGFIPLQGVDTIVRAAALLKNDNVNITIFGTGQTFESCQVLANELQASNVDFAGWQLPEKIALQAELSHLALGIFGTTDKASRVIPNKVYEAMAMGIPFVTMRSPAADELLVAGENCQLIDPGSPEQLAEAIRWSKSNPVELAAMAKASRELFTEVCSPAQVGETMHAAIDEVCRRAPRTRTSNARLRLPMVKTKAGQNSEHG